MPKQSLFSLALEEGEENVAAVAALIEDVQLPEEQTEAEGAILDTTEAAVAVDEQSGDIEETEADADALDEIADVLAEVPEDGIDPVAASIAAVATESIYRRLGVKNTKLNLASESFGGTASRKDSTKAALESISDSVKAVWEAIKKAIVTMAKFIKDFLVKFFDANESLHKEAIALQRVVRDSQGDPKTDILPVMNWARNLTIKGAMVKPEQLDNMLRQVGEIVHNTTKTIGLFDSYVAQHMDINGMAINPEDFNKLPVFDFTFGFSVPHIDGKTKLFYSPVMPGDSRITVSLTSAEGEGSNGMATISALKSVKIAVKQNPGTGDQKYYRLKTLSLHQMDKTLVEILQITASISKQRAEAEKLEHTHLGLVAKLDKLMEVYKGTGQYNKYSDEHGVNLRAKALQSMATAVNRLVGEMLTVSNRVALKSAHSAFQYVKLSASVYAQKA